MVESVFKANGYNDGLPVVNVAALACARLNSHASSKVDFELSAWLAIHVDNFCEHVLRWSAVVNHNYVILEKNCQNGSDSTHKFFRRDKRSIAVWLSSPMRFRDAISVRGVQTRKFLQARSRMNATTCAESKSKKCQI